MTSNGPWRPPQAHEGAGLVPVGEADPSGTGPGQGSRPEAPPEEIRAAWLLWLVATGFALVGMLLNSATAEFADLPAATRDAFRDAVTTSGTTDISVETLFSVAAAMGAVLALLVSAVTVWLAFRMRAGKGWARTLLDLASVFLVVDAVAVIVGVFGGVAGAGERNDVLSFAIMSLQVLAGLCAATAVWRQHTGAAMTFFADRGRSAGK